MPNNIINATSTGSGGLITTAADSGSLDLQSDGTTVLALTSSGATVTGTGSVSGNLSFNSGYGSAAVAYGCRAWVNFNGTSTVAIRGSGNVTSITDNGAGDYTVNFTTAMPDVNYATFGSGVTGTNDDDTGRYFLGVKGTSTTTTSSVRVVNVWSGDGSTLGDKAIATISIFR